MSPSANSTIALLVFISASWKQLCSRKLETVYEVDLVYKNRNRLECLNKH